MKLTQKQKYALELLSDREKIYYLFDGSSRSGKTVILIKFACLYALAFPGVPILIARYRFNHAKSSIWTRTLLPVLKEQYNGAYTINRSDLIINFNNGSFIELGGLEAGDRLDKILGTEYGLIIVNEITENPYSTIQTLISRLNWKDVPLKFLGDCNPKNPSHWCNLKFIKGLNPDTKERLSEKEHKKHCRLHWDVRDNKENLSDDYIDNLSNLTGIKRKRFYEGVWADTSEGGVYRFKRDINHVEEPIEYIDGAITWTGWDFGIADNVFIVWAQYIPVPKTEINKLGVEIHIIDEYYNNEKDYQYYANVVNGKPYKNVRHAGDPTGVQRGATMGSWISLLATCGIHIKYNTGFKPADYISNANVYMPVVRVCENQCPKIVEMFENWTYPKDKEGKVVEGKLPEHNEYSHPGTAWYYQTGVVYPPIKNELHLP
jgi:PBSX family phage terminase large subunit